LLKKKLDKHKKIKK